MKTDRRTFLQASLGVAAAGPYPPPAGANESDRCAIVIGPGARHLEMKAGWELQRYFEQLFSFTPAVVSSSPSSAQALILIGNPETNPAVKEAVAGNWPQLSDQGFVLRKVSAGGKPAMVVGGGSPIATLWAAYELLESYGVRFLFRDDYIPEEKLPFSLPTTDVVREPALPFRCWRVWNAHACGPECWGIDEQRRIIDQLVKRKFNVILVNLWSSQPFVQYEFRGVQKTTGDLFWGYKYPIDRMTIGREKFGGASEFVNPDFKDAKTYEDRLAAGQKLMHGILSYAKSYDMKTVVAFGLLDVPQEFKDHFKDWLPARTNESGGSNAFFICEGVYTHGVEVEGERFLDVENPALMDLVETVIRAHIDTYPEADYYEMGPPELRAPVGGYQRFWSALDAKYHVERIAPLNDMLEKAQRRDFDEKGRTKKEVESDIQFLYFLDKLINERKVLEKTERPNAKLIIDSLSEELDPVLPTLLPKQAGYRSFVDYTMSRVAKRTQVLASLKGLWTIQTVTLQDDNASMLSQSVGRATAQVLQALHRYGIKGYYIRFWMPCEIDPSAYILSRCSWEVELSADRAYRDLLTPICGNATTDAIAALGKIEDATAWGDANGMVSGGFPVVDCLLRFFETQQLASPTLEDSAARYGEALPIMIRARDAATRRGREFLDYYVGRLQFTINYIHTCQKAAQLGVAYKEFGERKQAKQIAATMAKRDEALKLASELEVLARASVESMARVAHDQSDRGMLAIVNRYVYHCARSVNLRMDLELGFWRIG